jgi:signal transduction histidine kinase
LGIAPPAPEVSGADGHAAVDWTPPVALAGPLREALQGQRAVLTQAFDQTVTFRLGGEERAFLPQVLPIQDPFGNTLGAAVVLNDVTRFRLLDQIKSDLVATVSHELKTPLTGVRLVLHLLLEETVGPLTPKQTELLLDARDNAERLLNMIEHLLALARLEHSRAALRPRPELPQALLGAAAEAVGPRAEAKHVELAVEAPADLPPVAADPERLGYALNNLLDNALTYTGQGGRITLSAQAGPGETVCLSVADTGTGIPPEYLPHVFERFFRVPGQSQGHGTGLGLAIVREIVTAHRGSITCESTPGQGTVFRLTLPVWSGEGGQS